MSLLGRFQYTYVDYGKEWIGHIYLDEDVPHLEYLDSFLKNWIKQCHEFLKNVVCIMYMHTST